MLPSVVVPRATPTRHWPLGFLGVFLLPLVAPGPSMGQDLVGCQLLEGTLQCVPGVTADPQQQIRILEGEIRRDQRLEGAVEQGIRDLEPVVLAGEAREGELLQATLQADRVAGLPPSAFHWYRRAPGRLVWELIEGAAGPSYTPVAGDVAYDLMVIVALPTSTGSERAGSDPVGPVRAAQAGRP